jgi:hypothetical protein
MKTALKVFGISMSTFVLILGTMFLFFRTDVHDPKICKNNQTLALEVARQLEAGEMQFYDMLYCPKMEERWGVGTTGGANK